MRFFEVPVAFGFQLSSSCPEQDSIFIENEDILYFEDHDQLIEKAAYGLTKKEQVRQMRLQAHAKVMNGHTYTHRAMEMLTHLQQ
jgi:spore maturation protein CgeB